MNTIEDTPLQLSTDKKIKQITKLSETFIYQIIPILQHLTTSQSLNITWCQKNNRYNSITTSN